MSLLRSLQLPTGGPERYTTRRVVFAHRFTLGEAPEAYPAGSYEVESREEAVEPGGYTAYVRTATMLIVPTPAGTCSRPVEGSELDDASLRDAERSGLCGPSENPDRSKADTRTATDADT